MLGTGTINDMFVPESWDDFVTALGTVDAYISMPKDAVYDMEKIAPLGVGQIAFNASTLYGNGMKILSPTDMQFVLARYTSTKAYAKHYIHDINIEKFNYTRPSGPMFYSAGSIFDVTTEIYDSAFSGLGYGSSAWMIIDDLQNSCSPDDEPYRSKDILKRCFINVELSLTSNNHSSLSIANNLYQCYCTIRLPETFNWGSITRPDPLSLLNSSYIEFLGPERTAIPTGSAATYGMDSIVEYPGNFASLVRPAQKTSVPCTKEQLHDPEWVKAQGFPLPYSEVVK